MHTNYGRSALFLILCIVAACGGPTERTEPVPPQPPQPAIESPTPTPVILAPTATPTPTPPALSQTQYGWTIQGADDLSNQTWLDQAARNGVTHIQIGGDALPSIDDVIFDSALQQNIRALARQADRSNIHTLIWGRELNLGDGLFRFTPTDPFYAARQAAYRNVFTQIPELDGVILQFSDAQSPPWDAAPPEGVNAPGPIERVRIVLEMVYQTVVIEQNKSLWVRIGNESDQAMEWILSAVSQLPEPQPAIVLAPNAWQFASPKRVAWLKQRTAGFNLLSESDAGLKSLGQGGLMASIAMPMAYQAIYSNRGTSSILDTTRLTESDSILTLNLFLARSAAHDTAFDPKASISEWAKTRFDISPNTPAHSFMMDFLSSSWQTAEKIAAVNNGPLFSFDWPVDDPPLFDDARLNYPDQELLTHIAQESYEAIRQTEDDRQAFSSIQSTLPPSVSMEWQQRLKVREQFARIYHYAKQCFFGFQLWQRTRNENEALYLEAHLKALESLASEFNENHNSEMMNLQELTGFITSIRQRFPRVLFGAREREWNRIENITIRQINAEQIEVIWNTQEPSKTECQLITGHPYSERAIEASIFPTENHSIILENLTPGTLYSLQLHAASLSGQSTLSGVYKIALDSSGFM